MLMIRLPIRRGVSGRSFLIQQKGWHAQGIETNLGAWFKEKGCEFPSERSTGVAAPGIAGLDSQHIPVS
jgi:hypothetical protein